jgi:hypothetical protein
MNAGTCWGKNTIDPSGRGIEKPGKATLTFNFFFMKFYVEGWSRNFVDAFQFRLKYKKILRQFCSKTHIQFFEHADCYSFEIIHGRKSL